MMLPVSWQLGAGLIVGLGTGWLHFLSLAHNLRLFTTGHLLLALLLQVLRIALTATVLVALAQLSWSAVLAGAIGLLLARTWAVKRRSATS